MKKLLLLIIIIATWTAACENQEQIFDDFDLKAVYFPHQLPVRTLSLGEDRIDNSLDKSFQFNMGVSIGGMYKNAKDWTVEYVVDNTLTENLFHNVTNAEILTLPASYYTLNPQNTIIIPKGVFNGLVRVQLTEAFFDDSMALTGDYVIPLRITGTSADSVLSGEPAIGVTNPDRRINADWEAGKLPKDWTLFGIKYINAYHGNYLQRGWDIRYLGDTPVDTVIYRGIHVEKDRVVSMNTIGKTRSATTFIAQNSSMTGEYAMELEFANMWGKPGGQITISPSDRSLYSVTGSGQYFDKATSVESWAGITWQSMHLNYNYSDGVYTHQVNDTLVFRDRGMVFETNVVKVVVP